MVIELFVFLAKVCPSFASREDARIILTGDRAMMANESEVVEVDPALRDACNIQGAIDSANGNQSNASSPTELLPKLKQCTAELEKFAEKTQAGHDASAEANKAYVAEFVAVMEELKKLKDVERLNSALRSDQEDALKVLLGEAEKATTEIANLAGGASASPPANASASPPANASASPPANASALLEDAVDGDRRRKRRR